MTSVTINKTGQDQVVLELMQTGNNETSVNLRHNLLDDQLQYMFSVASLSVPLNAADISGVNVDTELFVVRRRNVGELRTNIYVTAPFDSDFTLYANMKHYDVSSLVRALANWARGFNNDQSLAGILDPREFGGDSGEASAQSSVDNGIGIEILQPLTQAEINGGQGYNFLSVQVTPDGKLQITGTSSFWNNFHFEFSEYGAAILGLSSVVDADNMIAYTSPGPGQQNIARHYYGANDIILPANLLYDVHFVSDTPLWQSADQRLKVTVDSHLPMSANLEIKDQSETVNREIAEGFFESHLETAVQFDNWGTFTQMTMKSKLYSGQVSFIKKSDPHPEWHKLLTAYELRYFRFHLNIWYRTYTPGSGWSLVKRPLEVPTDKYWAMSIRFVSES